MKSTILSMYLTLLIYFLGNFNLIHAQQKIIKKGDSWSYYDSSTPPKDNWFLNNSIEDSWKTGISPLGYGDSFVKTELSFGNDPENKPITTYYRKTFRMGDPFKFILYKLKVQKDDGVVIYLNGSEIVRIDMPEGIINHNSMARGLIVSGKMESYVHTLILTPDDFIPGINIISASVHKARVNSIDCIFNLEIIGDNNPDMLPLLLKKRTLKNLKLHSKINELNSKLEIEKKDLQLKFIEYSRRNILNILIIISILLLTALISIYFLRKSHKEKENGLIISKLKLKDLIKTKDQEMMNLSISSLNSQQYLKELKKDLEKSISEDLKSTKKNITKITSQLEYNLEQDDDWDNLKKHFNAVHSGFIGKLIKLHPTLSETEIRHCVFMKLHMQTKEIARILHIDPRSVQASRYRIKKKMNLDESVDLKEYLQKTNKF